MYFTRLKFRHLWTFWSGNTNNENKQQQKVAKFRKNQKCRLLNWIQFILMKRKSLQDNNLIVRWELFPANFDVCSMSRCRHRFNWREGVKFRILGCKRRQDKIVTFLLKILCFTFYRVTKQVLDGELLLKIMEIRKISKSHEIRQIEVDSIPSTSQKGKQNFTNLSCHLWHSEILILCQKIVKY